MSELGIVVGESFKRNANGEEWEKTKEIHTELLAVRIFTTFNLKFCAFNKKTCLIERLDRLKVSACLVTLLFGILKI